MSSFKTQREWRAQAGQRKNPLTIHYFHDARMAVPSLYKGYSSDPISARGNAYRRIGIELYNKAVIVDERTGIVQCELRRDPRTGNIEVHDLRYEELM